MADKKDTVQNVFKDIENFARYQGVTDNTKSRKSISWYQNQIKNMKNISRFDLIASQKKFQKSKPKPGTMNFFFYSPIGKKELPYYDTFPLSIFVEPVTSKNGQGFYGLNVHYLPPALRAKLYTQLLKYNRANRFDLSYQLLKSLAGSIWKPAFKHYLFKQVKSNFTEVQEEDMTTAIFLPVSSFKKASQSKVWSDSRKAIKG